MVNVIDPFPTIYFLRMSLDEYQQYLSERFDIETGKQWRFAVDHISDHDIVWLYYLYWSDCEQYGYRRGRPILPTREDDEERRRRTDDEDEAILEALRRGENLQINRLGKIAGSKPV